MRLGDGPREAVEQRPADATNPLTDHRYDELVWHELALCHIDGSLPSQLGIAGAVVAKQIAGRDVGELELVYQPGGLRTLPDAGRSDEYDHELLGRDAHIRIGTRSKPSDTMRMVIQALYPVGERR